MINWLLCLQVSWCWLWSVKTVMWFCSTLTTVTLPHITEHLSSEVHLAKMTSCGLCLNSVVPALLLTWFGQPRQTRWEKSGLHISAVRFCVAWHICMPTELFTGTLKVKTFCWLTMPKSNWVRVITCDMKSSSCTVFWWYALHL